MQPAPRGAVHEAIVARSRRLRLEGTEGETLDGSSWIWIDFDELG